MGINRATRLALCGLLAWSLFATLARAAPAPSAHEEAGWRKSLLRVPRPGKGCFVTSYPETRWSAVACVAAPKLALRPSRGGGSTLSVGGGSDFTAQVPGEAAVAVGSFDVVSGVTSESGAGTANAYTLQLNTQFFTTTTCNGTAGCTGWEQFVFYNSPPSQGLLFIQYWLLGYGTCPSGWMSSSGFCYRNSETAIEIPAQTIATLSAIQLAGEAAAGGADDSTILAIGNRMYSLTGGNFFPDLGAHWQVSEFNIFGPGSGSAAVFNQGSTLTVRTEMDSGASNAPACVQQGYTAETNNLNLVGAPTSPSPSSSPAIVFTESNSGSAAPACDTLYALAATDAPLPWWTYLALAASFIASVRIVGSRQPRPAAAASSRPQAR